MAQVKQTCTCGKELLESSMKKHLNSQYHKKRTGQIEVPKKPPRRFKKIQCECGCFVCCNVMKRHRETKKHKRLMKKNNEELPLAKQQELFQDLLTGKITKAEYDKRMGSAIIPLY